MQFLDLTDFVPALSAPSKGRGVRRPDAHCSVYASIYRKPNTDHAYLELHIGLELLQHLDARPGDRLQLTVNPLSGFSAVLKADNGFVAGQNKKQPYVKVRFPTRLLPLKTVEAALTNRVTHGLYRTQHGPAIALEINHLMRPQG